MGPQKLDGISFACLMNDVLYVNDSYQRLLYAYKMEKDVETEKRNVKTPILFKREKLQ